MSIFLINYLITSYQYVIYGVNTHTKTLQVVVQEIHIGWRPQILAVVNDLLSFGELLLSTKQYQQPIRGSFWVVLDWDSSRVCEENGKQKHWQPPQIDLHQLHNQTYLDVVPILSRVSS